MTVSHSPVTCASATKKIKMVEFEETLTKTPRLQWTDADIEASGRRPELRRTNSNISNASNTSIPSFNGARSRRGSIDPAAALPIQYRTVSFQIDESAAELKKVKDDAAKGMYSTRYSVSGLLTSR